MILLDGVDECDVTRADATKAAEEAMATFDELFKKESGKAMPAEARTVCVLMFTLGAGWMRSELYSRATTFAEGMIAMIEKDGVTPN